MTALPSPILKRLPDHEQSYYLAGNYVLSDFFSESLDDFFNFLCWTSVPTVTKILPHHNKYVLDSQPRILREKELVLLLLDVVVYYALNWHF